MLGHHGTEECFQNTHVACKVSISHPCDTVNGNKSHNARTEYLAVPHFLRFRFAGKENEGGNKKHHHLDNGSHRDSSHLSLRIREMREQIREVAKDGNADNPYEENPRRMIIGRRQFTPLQSFIVTVDILFCSGSFIISWNASSFSKSLPRL